MLRGTLSEGPGKDTDGMEKIVRETLLQSRVHFQGLHGQDEMRWSTLSRGSGQDKEFGVHCQGGPGKDKDEVEYNGRGPGYDKMDGVHCQEGLVRIKMGWSTL